MDAIEKSEELDGEDVEKYFVETDVEWDNSAPLTPTPSTSSTVQTQSTPNNEKSVAAGKPLSRARTWVARFRARRV